MKSTAGKTKPSRPERTVQIYSRVGKRERLMAVLKGRSLKACLEEYYERTLREQGATDKHVTGNVLTVNLKGHDKTYIAKDCS